MSVHLKLLSGDILTFSISEISKKYTFSNLRSEFYQLMSNQLSISELESILIFDNNEEYNYQVDLNDIVTEGKIYNVFVNQVTVRLVFDENSRKVNFEHDYKQFPFDTIIQIGTSVQNNYKDSYDYMYNEISQSFQQEIDFFDNDSDNFWTEKPLKTFREYINEKYDNDNYELILEELIGEYINKFISKHINVQEFIYL
jgi:hypothetical protein